MTNKSSLKNNRKGVASNTLSGAEQANIGSSAMPDTNSTGPFSSVSSLDTPVVRKSTSPTGSQTKSIMNASGTSGAVVSNTPEPGLKGYQLLHSAIQSWVVSDRMWSKLHLTRWPDSPAKRKQRLYTSQRRVQIKEET